jgi:hypothetical protein
MLERKCSRECGSGKAVAPTMLAIAIKFATMVEMLSNIMMIFPLSANASMLERWDQSTDSGSEEKIFGVELVKERLW